MASLLPGPDGLFEVKHH